jgi:hypothetical protein
MLQAALRRFGSERRLGLQAALQLLDGGEVEADAILEALHGGPQVLAQLQQLKPPRARSTAMKKWRIVISGFGTARQKMVLE